MGRVNRNFPRHLQRCARVAREHSGRDTLKGVPYKHCALRTLRRDHRGREKDRYFRRVSVSVTTTLARPPEIARAAALAFRSLPNNPKTADPLPDIAAWVAPRRRSRDTARVMPG